MVLWLEWCVCARCVCDRLLFGLSLLLSQSRQNKGTRSLALTSVVQLVESNIPKPAFAGFFSFLANDPQ
ncbi:hypothetical protein VCRA2128O305_30366 [Vibrio crassostreae]|nr:hypothetical protein VCRA2112O187_110052 [Vibrio crassostreae]CAK1884786.1 hypothetical protein VCRA2113O324_10410 [Vibrio crassostreae]CAK1888833.1 hypothetical protein VCRA2113O326_10413 [Vibrio crassostreae]CAK1968081.1 hypothetical protein VCRA2113O213_20010 [Vibrio crassostreae]CAK1988944.1 hypothetical protein VCRA2113O207_20367 [Vibrio crassostreae]